MLAAKSTSSALDLPGDPRRARRRQADERQPFDDVDADDRADGLEEPGTRSICTSSSRKRADELDEEVVPVVGESDDDTVARRCGERSR